MDRLDSMSVLLSVVEAGSLSAAARKLGKPLTTISRKVSDLERHLGARLLNRSNRNLDLTDAGRSYVAACKRILDEVQEVERAASGEYSSPKGELVITAPVVFGRLHVLPIIVAFLTEYPEVDIRMVLADRVVSLRDDHIDLAVRIGALPDSSLVATRLGKTGLVVCASPAYFSKRGRPEIPGELASHTCINFENLAGPDNWLFKSDHSDLVVGIQSRLTVNTAEAAIDAAVAGLGLTRVFSYQIAEAQDAGLLQVILTDFERAPSPVSLVYAGQGQLPQKLRAFLDFAAPRLRTALKRGSSHG